MFIIYDLIFLLIAIIYLPVYLFKRKFHRGFLTRLGFLPKGLALDNPVWIHAVSVGEAMAAKSLVKGLRDAYPDRSFFISTVTPTGNKIAQAIAGESDFVSYAPLDFSFIVRRSVDKVKPSLLIVMETEIWPNLVSCFYQRGIPVILVNARISDRSFRGYSGVKLLLKPILNKIALFCVQSKSDAERFLRLGVSEEKIRVTGNMKFDNLDYADSKKEDTDYRLKLGLNFDEKLFAAGSTHPGEEEIILDVYRSLLGKFSNLKLLIAPRHPERAKEIKNLTERANFKAVLISTLERKPKTENRKPIFILDTVGQLMNYYAIADIVFVGGSLVRKGGHNILEPAALGKPVIFGPYMSNFRDTARLFLDNKAAISALSPADLKNKIRYLLENPSRIPELSSAAKKLILENQGATRRNLECIHDYAFKRLQKLR